LSTFCAIVSQHCFVRSHSHFLHSNTGASYIKSNNGFF
jgi:hypothetical protein